jgi:hypothetical protein
MSMLPLLVATKLSPVPTPIDIHAHKNIVTPTFVSSPSWGWGWYFSLSIENNSFLLFYDGGTIAKYSNFSLQSVTLSSKHATRNFRQRGNFFFFFLDGGVATVLATREFKAKFDATVPVTLVMNVAETDKFRLRYTMAHKPRYSFDVSVASATDYILTVLVPVSGKGSCYSCGAINNPMTPPNPWIWAYECWLECYVQFRLWNMHELWVSRYRAPNPTPLTSGYGDLL